MKFGKISMRLGLSYRREERGESWVWFMTLCSDAGIGMVFGFTVILRLDADFIMLVNYNLFFKLNMKANIAFTYMISNVWSATRDLKQVKHPLRD